MQYKSLIKALRGKPAMLEVGDVTRQAVEVVRGFIWDTFFDDALVLVIVFRDETVQRFGPDNKPAVVDGKTVMDRFREFDFKWVRLANVITVESDTTVKINIGERKLIRSKPDALYSDGMTGWPVLNNALSRRIVKELEDLGLNPEFRGIYRNDANDPILEADALTAATPPVMIGVPAAVAEKPPETVTATPPAQS